ETGTGTPIGGAVVVAVDLSTGTPDAWVRTDGAGQFTIPDLTPGAHLVAYLDPTGGAAARHHPHPPHALRAHPLSQACSTAAAPRVRGPAGRLTPAYGTIPVQTPVGTGQAITGRVTDSVTGHALPGELVFTLRSSDFSLGRAGFTTASGGYVLNVSTGSYRV